MSDTHLNEVSAPFIEGMKNRMYVSFYKYGAVRDAYPAKADALKSLELRLAKYRETKNTEFLLDAANFAMIEFMCPSIEGAFFQGTDSDQSPGRIERGNPTPVAYPNRDLLPVEDRLSEQPAVQGEEREG